MSYRNLASIDWSNWCPVEVGTLLYVFDGSRILLIRKKRGLGAGKINGPGGRIDGSEAPLERLKRKSAFLLLTHSLLVVCVTRIQMGTLWTFLFIVLKVIPVIYDVPMKQSHIGSI